MTSHKTDATSPHRQIEPSTDGASAGPSPHQKEEDADKHQVPRARQTRARSGAALDQESGRRKTASKDGTFAQAQ